VYIYMVDNNERDQARPAPCRTCRGTGVVRAQDGPISSDTGVFCIECKDGRDRWQATLKTIAAHDKPTVMPTPIRERQTRVFV
jgi:hypothetical protein